MTNGISVRLIGLQLNFDFNSCRELERRDCFNRLLRRLDNINQSLVGSQFKLFTRVLVLVNCTKNGNDFALGGERNRSGNGSTVSLCTFNDLFCCLIDESVIVGLQSDSDLLACCHFGLPPFKMIGFKRRHRCVYAACLRMCSHCV